MSVQSVVFFFESFGFGIENFSSTIINGIFFVDQSNLVSIANMITFSKKFHQIFDSSKIAKIAEIIQN